MNKADDELQAAIKKYAEDNKVTEAIATRDFMKTNEGRSLYARASTSRTTRKGYPSHMRRVAADPRSEGRK